MDIRVIRSSTGGKNPIVGGIIIAVLFGLATLACAFSGDVDELFGVMIFFAIIAMGGVSLIVKGFQMKNKAKSQPHPTHEFDVDAPDFVKERLNQLMFEGNGGSTTSSRTVKRVTIVGPDGVKRTTETIIENGDEIKPKGYHAGTVTCEACGGINKLRRGQNGVCEYCGSHIQG